MPTRASTPSSANANQFGAIDEERRDKEMGTSDTVTRRCIEAEARYAASPHTLRKAYGFL